MNRTDHCPACNGGGLVPAPGCSCGGNAHTCTPVICTACDGTGLGKKVEGDGDELLGTALEGRAGQPGSGEPPDDDDR